MAADEEDYLDLVIAGELVAQWLQVIKASSRMDRYFKTQRDRRHLPPWWSE